VSGARAEDRATLEGALAVDALKVDTTAADAAEAEDALVAALVAALAANDDGRPLEDGAMDDDALLAADPDFGSVCDARRDGWLARIMDENE
jgi:hypothetical protein